MNDIRREDLRIDISTVGSPHYGETRPATDEEFDRIAREAGYIKVTDECQRCGGTGQTYDEGPERYEMDVCPNLRCIAGRVLRDRVERIEPWEEFVNGDPVAALFIAGPFEWLEADDG